MQAQVSSFPSNLIDAFPLPRVIECDSSPLTPIASQDCCISSLGLRLSTALMKIYIATLKAKNEPETQIFMNAIVCQ